MASLDQQKSTDTLLPINAVTNLWLIVYTLLTIIFMLQVAPFRADLLQQLLTQPLFTAEVICGILAYTFFAWAAFESSIPGKRNKGIDDLQLFTAAVVFFCIWLGIIIYAYFYPLFEFTMRGKRVKCYIEALRYSIPAAAITVWMITKRYPMRVRLSACATGFAVALLPAVLMQMACMHDSYHALTHHVAPVFIVTILSALIIFTILKYRQESS